MRLKYILISITLFYYLVGNGQEAMHWQLTDDNGLPSNTVYDLLVADDYIWIGSENGLVKYNGTSSVLIEGVDQVSPEITGLNTDESGTVWCYNFHNQIFKVEDEQLVLFAVPKEIRTSSKGFLRYYLDKDIIWVYDNERLYSYDKAADQWSEDWMQNTESLVKNNVRDWILGITSLEEKKYLILHRGIYEIGSDSLMELLIFDENETYQNFAIGPNSILFLSNTNEKSRIVRYIPTENRLTCVKNQLVQDLKTKFLSGYYHANLGWVVGTTNGLYCLSKEGSIENHFMKNHRISDAVIDAEDNLWMSDLQDGAYIFPDFKLEVYNGDNSELANEAISSLFLHKGVIYAGSYNGYVYTFLEGSISSHTHARVEKEINGFIAVNEKVYAYGYNVFGVTFDSEWKLNNENVKNIAQLEQGLWLIQESGYLSIYGENSLPEIEDAPFAGLSKKSNRLEFSGITLNEFYYDSSAMVLYASTNEGLYKYSALEKKQLEKKRKGFVVQCFYQQGDTLWVGTSKGEILALVNDEVVIETSLKSNSESKAKVKINALMVSDGIIYSGTNLGFYKTVLSSGEQTVINKLDGLPSSQINDILLHKSDLWLATTKGIALVDESKNGTNHHGHTVKLKRFEVNHQNCASCMELSYDQNNVEIEVESIGYKHRGSAVLEYRLGGLDSSWEIIPINNGIIHFNSLAPGEYTFELRSRNEDGVVSVNTIKKKFRIDGPYWTKWWFYLMFIGVGVLAVGILASVRIRMINRRNRVQGELRVSQLIAIKAQMNPHFVFNALNSIQEYVMLNESELANDYLGKFARLMRKVLNMSNQEFVTLGEEIEMLSLYLELEQLRFEDGFTFTLNYDRELLQEDYLVPSMIVQPFAENAIQHGLMHKKTDRVLSIHFKSHGQSIICFIVDNGIGREAAEKINQLRPKEHKSFSMDAIDRRVALYNTDKDEKNNISVEIEDLEEESGNSGGTKVVIRFPKNLSK